jgi:branched-chain amino acid transport system permease protein
MDITLLEQYTLTGLMIGVVYIVMALGITFIYSIMKMVNWAMGEFYMIGSFVQYLVVVNILGPDLWYLALPVAFITVFAIGWIVETVLVRPMFQQGAGRRDEYATVVTIALALVLRGVAAGLSGPFQRTPGTNLTTIQIGPLPVAGDRIAACVGGLIVLGIFYLAIKYTWWGMALRAASQSRIGVQTVGVNVMRIDQVAFAIGVGLAAVAGGLLASVNLVYPLDGMVTTTKGFETVIIGGLGSIPGAVIGGLIIGLSEGLGGALLDPNYQNAYGFLVVIFILFLRPKTGLFGQADRVA